MTRRRARGSLRRVTAKNRQKPVFKNSKKAKLQALENEKLAADFLANNSKADDVHETASGLQYKIEQSSGNDTKPSATSKVKVHYHGTLMDGSVFDSSVVRNSPISFGLNQEFKDFWRQILKCIDVYFSLFCIKLI